jgi:hypothetical protein
MALVESKENFANDTKGLVLQVLASYGLKPQDLGEKTMIFVQSSIQTIMQIFKDRVFNK